MKSVISHETARFLVFKTLAVDGFRLYYSYGLVKI